MDGERHARLVRIEECIPQNRGPLHQRIVRHEWTGSEKGEGVAGREALKLQQTQNGKTDPDSQSVVRFFNGNDATS